MVKSLVSKLSSASIANTFNGNHGKSAYAIGGETVSSAAGPATVNGDHYQKYRNDPGRFFGDGVQFKAKLIGILEVGEARGDRMCQEALQDLKMAIRAAGEHKQRITIHVTIDGLRLRDEKTGDSLYHHPVHKISFIAQDMTDTRAFGYIFGSPDSGHRFFGIKTDKAASQVVLAMRDLFQVVFELKKKEIELARQQIQSKTLHHDHQQQLSSLSSLRSVTATASGAAGVNSGQNDLSAGLTNISSGGVLGSSLGGVTTNTATLNRLNVNIDNKGAAKELSPESVADLVDLEQELSSLQRGITQMERITPNDTPPAIAGSGIKNNSVSVNDDPFGDSFTTYSLLPPPEPGRSRSKANNKAIDMGVTTSAASNSTTTPAQGQPRSSPTLNAQNLPSLDDEDCWLRELDTQNDVFDTSKTTLPGLMGITTWTGNVMAPLAASETSLTTPTQQLYAAIGSAPTSTDVVTELTPNMTTVNTAATLTETNNVTNSSSLTDLFQTTSGLCEANQTISSTQIKSEPVNGSSNTADQVMLPRDTDPFSPTRKKSDPFEEGGEIFSKLDPFEFEFNTSEEVGEESLKKSFASSAACIEGGEQSSSDVFSGHLQVNLPPESGIQAMTVTSTIRSRPNASAIVPPLSSANATSSVFKQQTVDVLSSISNKKIPHLFGQSSRFSKRDSNSINMRRLQESDSLSENEAAPEPPPRPDSSSYAEPPPLPPKKQFNDIIIKPRTPLSQTSLNNGYEFINANGSGSKLVTGTRSSASIIVEVPPIPLPSRKVGRSEGNYPGPGRPRKPGHSEDDYLTPLGTHVNPSGSQGNSNLDVPPLLPPPTQVSSRARTQRQYSLHQTKAQDIYENKNEILQQQQQQQQQQKQQQQPVTAATIQQTIVPDITLSQLLTLSIDELSAKLNVPISKLSTMTLVELTSYLSEFLEKSKPKTLHESKLDHIPTIETSVEQTPSIFKINFDQEATFVAKFDDTFGENLVLQTNHASFEANFAQFDKMNMESAIEEICQTPAVPPADRYAVFREIIDQELQQQKQDTNLIGDLVLSGDQSSDVDADNLNHVQFQMQFPSGGSESSIIRQDILSGELVDVNPVPAKIDTKITEVVAQAKDRYAALRDIILVENLFEKPLQRPGESLCVESKSPAPSSTGFNDDDDDFNNEDHDLRQLMDGGAVLESCAQQQRMGLVDSRGLLVEPSSSALTVDDEDDEEEAERGSRTRTEINEEGEEDVGCASSADSHEKDGKEILPTGKYEQLPNSTQQMEQVDEKAGKTEENPKISITQSQTEPCTENKLLTVASVATSSLSGSKDDLEIDALMHRAISNLSLDSRERNSPANSTTQSLPAIPAENTTATTATTTMTPQHFNDVSTSPIQMHRSPLPIQASSGTSANKSLQSKQISPLPTQLTAVSQLIDTATKEIEADTLAKVSVDSWATFDTPQDQPSIDRRSRPAVKSLAKSTNFLHLPPPPAPASNTSQNDTAGESPCSSDPRDEAWHKRSGGNVSSGHHSAATPGGSRRWHKKERQHTSSSSRDLSWDDEQGPVSQEYLQSKRPPASVGGSILNTDRHAYHTRYIKRMNSCDEDYDYEEEFSGNRRDQRKFKTTLSRSRDNFELDSPAWYHHGTLPHHTWSSQDIEQARGRAYERNLYGLSIYDKRGIPLPPPPLMSTASHDRRSNIGYEKRNKFYRNEHARNSNSDFDDFGDVLPYRDSNADSFEKLKMPRRPDYENIFDEGRHTPPSMGGGFKSQRPVDMYLYDRDRKSFDRESIESFESSTAPRRRRRSFGSSAGGGGPTPDSYGSFEVRDEYRDHRYMSSEKTRSLRKTVKGSRISGDIDYEQDSDRDQRPSRSHIITPAAGGPGSVMIAYYYRKKQRPRNKAAQCTVTGGRYRDNTSTSGTRPGSYDYITCGDDIDDDVEDYVDEEEEEEGMEDDDDEMPTDEDKFDRLNRRRHEMNQRMMESEQRRHHGSKAKVIAGSLSGSSLSGYRKSAKIYARQRLPPPERAHQDYGFEDVEYEQTPTPKSNTSSTLPTATPNTSTKFSFDVGFESDFNQSSPPPAPAGTASSCNSTPVTSVSATNTPATKASFRFSNDFSAGLEREKHLTPQLSSSHLYDLESRGIPSPQSSTGGGGGGSSSQSAAQKLRFDDNVKVSQFDDSAAFEDDFSRATFDAFENDDQWREALQKTTNAVNNKKQQMRNSILQQRQQELIKKSESINIFARKSEDPFEDDEFFKSPSTSADIVVTTTATSNNTIVDKVDTHKNSSDGSNHFSHTHSHQHLWEDDNSNFAKFDEHM
ncbi:protein disabled isoform X1 [Glossina fuscipes]|uniref:Protein disabled isoform X1 n=1 Tax=Glossina fuscipes TaxID=7396 RepID=A0A9C5ZNY2_9MUSC|nr:protein disabled isoform X1 [Glossina fuscipes]XP_037900714.1 protein disabled isoform X1 [Glossina fuscipes]XP_037900715.1 protein disabled isoform X1 [Glossina fuscipes]XP_037900716.1 protein disabled isoform X1 [Glossina fuscipes]